MDLGLFGGWAGMAGALIEAMVFCSYAVLLLRLAGKTTVGAARILDFVSTVAMGTMIGSTIISKSIALTTGLAGLTALVALQWAVAYASSRNPSFYRLTTNTPSLLYDGSRFLEENLRAERITRQDVLAKVREGGHPTLGSVAAVVLETTGNVAVIGSSGPSEPAEPDEDVWARWPDAAKDPPDPGFIHRSAWRDCLKDSWRASRAYVLVSQGGQMGLLHPFLATHGAPIWSLPRIFKQSRRNCLKSLRGGPIVSPSA